VSHDKDKDRIQRCDGGLSEFLPYQLLTAGYWPAVVVTGDGGLGFDSGEGA